MLKARATTGSSETHGAPLEYMEEKYLKT